MPTLLLRALGIAETREEIIDILGDSEMVIRTLARDPATTKEESLIELYRRFRPGEPPTVDSAESLSELAALADTAPQVVRFLGGPGAGAEHALPAESLSEAAATLADTLHNAPER